MGINTHAPQNTVQLPGALEHLGVDARGYRVIATVERSPGDVDFGSINERRKLALAAFDWCAVCGTPFGDQLRWQMVQPGQVVTRGAVVCGEAPVHEVCALYAAQVCPFLSSSRARLGDEFRKGAVRPPQVRFAGFPATSAVSAMESGLQPGHHVLHFEHRDMAEEFSYRSPQELQERFASALASQRCVDVSEPEGELIRLFNRLDDGGEGDVVTGAALAVGAVFAKDIFKVQGMKAFSRDYGNVGALLLKGSQQQIEEFASTSKDEAFRAVARWVLDKGHDLPGPLKQWRRRGQGMVRWNPVPAESGPGRAVAKNAPCPCGSGRKARRCHPGGVHAL